MQFISPEVEQEFLIYFDNCHESNDLMGLSLSFFLWVIFLRRPGILSLSEVLFLGVTFFAISLHIILLATHCFFHKAYGCLRRAGLILIVNINMLAIAMSTKLIKSAVQKGFDESAMLTYVLLSKWPYLVSHAICFRLPVDDIPISLFPPLLYMHVFAGMSYVDGPLDKLVFVQRIAQIMTNHLQSIIAYLGPWLLSWDSGSGMDVAEAAGKFQVTGRQAITTLWLLMQSLAFWGSVIYADQKERHIRRTYLRKHVPDKKCPQWCTVHQYIVMACINIYVFSRVLLI
eukprot:jgi/Botrbrau1/14950/Bobra.0018s0054.1